MNVPAHGDVSDEPPLKGLRIVDLTRLLPGPLATRQLVQWGAEVLKVEDPRDGDGTRHMLLSAEDRAADSEAGLFRHLNLGKQLHRIDLRTPEGREQLLAMVRGADALVEGFRPGVMDRLGLGWNVLREANPRLVMCAITGYGQTGPYAQRAGHDINYIALAGVLAQCGPLDGDPVVPNFQIADLMGGTQSALSGLLAALIGAQRTGRGRFVDVSMTRQVWEHHVISRFEARALGAPTRPGRGLLSGGSPCYNVYRTADGRHLAVGALELKFWAKLCEVVGRPDWADRHWSLGQRPASSDALALRAELQAVIGAQPLAHWVPLFEAADCCVTPVLRLDEVPQHPWFGG
jgi:crotonobetainyl-CoA:carnitine CoA-transferase CaiB-like acyl-CoA transferase